MLWDAAVGSGAKAFHPGLLHLPFVPQKPGAKTASKLAQTEFTQKKLANRLKKVENGWNKLKHIVERTLLLFRCDSFFAVPREKHVRKMICKLDCRKNSNSTEWIAQNNHRLFCKALSVACSAVVAVTLVWVYPHSTFCQSPLKFLPVLTQSNASPVSPAPSHAMSQDWNDMSNRLGMIKGCIVCELFAFLHKCSTQI